MDFCEATNELAAAMGLPPVVPDETGAFSLLFDNRCEIAFSPASEDGSVIFHADLGDASPLDGAACRALLTASLLGAKTGGAAFSIDPGTARVIFWKRYGAFAGRADLEKALGEFLGQVLFWQKRLADGSLSETERTEPDSSPLPPWHLNEMIAI